MSEQLNFLGKLLEELTLFVGICSIPVNFYGDGRGGVIRDRDSPSTC
jgi:hypothetical protein